MAGHGLEGPVGFLDGVWNPEDLVDLPGSPWIIVSAMRSRGRPGGLLAARIGEDKPAAELPWSRQATAGRLDPSLFDPHGIAAKPVGDGVYELLVIDHGGGEAVGRLRIEIRGDQPITCAGERIEQPPGTSGNALAHMPDGGFVLSSMFDPGDPLTLDKFAKGEITGGVWRWSLSSGWRRFGSHGLSGANGIAATADGEAVLVSEWSARRVWRLGAEGRPEAYVKTPFLPDNLRWRPDGMLLLAGQRARPEAVFGCAARGEPSPLGFEIALVDPNEMTLETLVRFDHDAARRAGFGGATGALAVGGEIWVGSFTGARIAKFRAL